MTGLVASVVYGGLGKPLASGAPETPEKTWFQTPFVQNPTLLFRTRNCCWEPLITNGRSESEMKPPLEYCGPAVQ